MSPKGCENVARKSFYIKVLIELTVKLGFSELFFSLSVFCNDTCSVIITNKRANA